MPNKDISESGTIHHHLSEIQRLHDEKDRLDRQIGDLSQKRREANIGYHHHVAAVAPFFEALPGDVVIEMFGAAFWLDAKEGMCICRLRPWLDLVPDVEPEPPFAAAPACDNCGNALTDCGGHHRCFKCGNTYTPGCGKTCTPKPVVIPAPDAKPMSWAEQQAKLPYVPEPVILTDAQIDEGSEPITPEMETAAARRMAFESALMLPEADIEAIAEHFELNEDSDLHAVRTLDGHTYIENGSAS